MRIIVTAGWSIYPLGYFCGYLLGAVDETLLIVVYNVAGFVNKIARDRMLVCGQGRKNCASSTRQTCTLPQGI